MKSAPIPKNEKERLISLHTLGLLDTKPEERFDRITRTATKVFNVSISTLTLIDEKREWFKSVCGLDQREGDRAISFCGHALLSHKIFIISDTKKDKRFSDNPMVTGKPYIRFYAGVPIINADGQRIGVFCIKDTKPRPFSKSDEEILKNLSAWAELEINSRNLSLALSEGRKYQTQLKAQAQKLGNFRVASQNVLEDLEIEKSKVDIAKAREEAILLSIGDGLLATDEKGNIIFINKTAEKLLGIKNKEVVGKFLSKVVSMEDEKGILIPLAKRPVNMALVNTTTTTTTTAGPSYYYIRKDKTKFPAAIMVTPIILDKKVIGAIEVLRDITKEKEIDKAKSEFISLASHQLKTPPTAVKILTERILAGELGKITEKQREYISDVRSSNQRMIDIVNTLLDVSHIELGTFTIELKEKDICAVLKNMLHELKPVSAKKQLMIKEVYQKNRKMILISEPLFRMIINNLLVNAINYTEDRGNIKVECCEINKGQILGGKFLNENSVAVIITDTGYGIPEDQQGKLFTKFFRADNVRQKQTDGTGLGLYIVKSILDNTGGSIWFSSKENKGSTFYVTIPITGMRSKKDKN